MKSIINKPEEKKLTIEHLAPYLPYGLKIQWRFMIDAEYTHTDVLTWKNIADIIHQPFIKPILRPLSDLTKEIEVNGEMVVPEEYFNKNCNKYYLPEDWDAVLFIQSENILSVNYAIIQMLFSWHFDIFNLIPEGLAIDINTLK